MKIGIGITTTPERKEVFDYTYSAICKFGIDNMLIYYYNDIDRIGVSKSKNNCLEVLCNNNCTHFFLFDDDCYPTVNNWWEHYINSNLNHACWNYDKRLIAVNKSIDLLRNPPIHIPAYNEYEKPNGCMLYVKRNVLDIVGGFDTAFLGYGYEHPNWSDRIYNNGLTPARYIDVPNSEELFRLIECESSFTMQDRLQIPINYELYQQKYYSKEFKPFK